MYFDSSRGGNDITFELTGIGWLECRIRIGKSRANVTASYISDAPGDFLSAVIAVMRRSPSATITFWDEPGSYHWILERITSERVRIQILGFPGEYRLFYDECLLRDFAIEVVAAFDRLKQECGEEGFLAKWVRDEFPTELVDELRRLL